MRRGPLQKVMGFIKIHFHPEEISELSSAAITVGTFDGVHLGHRKILRKLVEIAGRTGSEPVLVTFDPHPRIALKKDDDRLRLLNTLGEKAALLEQIGVKHLVVLNFNLDFSKLSAEQFIGEYLVKRMHIHYLVVGFNHRFGHDRLGDFAALSSWGKHYGFEVEEVTREDLNAVTVSSTQIRNALSSGDLVSANRMLGYPYQLTAKVVHGNKTGRELGFPTANLLVENPYKLIPANGVYAVTVSMGENQLKGMCNIGFRPTFGENSFVAEVNLFDFDEDIYGRALEIRFISRLRDEKRFSSRKELIIQLECDRRQAVKILNDFTNGLSDNS